MWNKSKQCMEADVDDIGLQTLLAHNLAIELMELVMDMDKMEDDPDITCAKDGSIVQRCKC